MGNLNDDPGPTPKMHERPITVKPINQTKMVVNTRTTAHIPTIVWMYWHTGRQDAPDLVKCCYDSWCYRNPDWDVIFLDARNIDDYIRIPMDSARFSKLSKNHQSDLIRLGLLNEYGGVWADATCYCASPLEDWLLDNLESGLCVFASEAREKKICSWFLASVPGHYVIRTMFNELCRYWQEHDFRPETRATARLRSSLHKIFRRSEWAASWWFSWPVRRVLRVYHYFSIHYLFNYLVYKDSRFRELWMRTSICSGQRAHRLQRFGMANRMTEELHQELEQGAFAVHKLSWKPKDNNGVDLSGDAHLPPDSVYAYLCKPDQRSWWNQ